MPSIVTLRCFGSLLLWFHTDPGEDWNRIIHSLQDIRRRTVVNLFAIIACQNTVYKMRDHFHQKKRYKMSSNSNSKTFFLIVFCWKFFPKNIFHKIAGVATPTNVHCKKYFCLTHRFWKKCTFVRIKVFPSLLILCYNFFYFLFRIQIHFIYLIAHRSGKGANVFS